jgi:ribonucleoside-diphosphate reductase alpha chain
MENSTEMRVTKRNGQLEDIAFDKILKRIKIIGNKANIQINYSSLAIKVIDQLYDTISTTKLDELTAEQCASLTTQHPDYGTLASHIIISNHQKNTDPSFSNVMKKLYEFINIHGIQKSLVSQQLYDFVEKNANILDNIIDHNRDYLIDFFGFKTLERAYLFRINNKVVERIQHMWLRVSIGIHGDLNNNEKSLSLIKETYDLMSQKYFIHATPTLFNAGTPRPQLSSCFLIAMEEDSVDGIYNTLTDCAKISKYSGGIGLHIHNIRAKGSHIQGTNGISNGIVPMLKVFNSTSRHIDQSGKRNGSFAIYLEPWHADIEDFLEMKKNHGDEELKARDLFYALWISDLFMERIKNNEKWTLFCPHECPGLSDVYGEKFKTLYLKYELEQNFKKRINARDLWFKILDSQMETGAPYLLYKDAANNKSNQKNLGTIKSSNLCVAPETLILTDTGHREIQSLEGKEVNVWNGFEWSKVQIFKTGENQELIQITTNDGSILNCTPYHKFYIQDSYLKSSIKIIEAKDLKPNDKLIKCEYPIIDGFEKMKYAYTHGFFCGDGTYNKNLNHLKKNCCNKALINFSYCKRHIDFKTDEEEYPVQTENTNYICKGISYDKKPILALYGEKKELLKYLEYRSVGNEDITNNKLNLSLHLDINEKFFVPLNCLLIDKMNWFSGYCDADGCIARNGTNEQLQISCINKDFLIQIKLMLQTCGINSKVTNMRLKGERLLPNSQKELQLYSCQQIYRLLINSTDLQKIIRLGFNPKRLKINLREPNRNACKFILILNVINNNRFDNTYCFTEPKKHMGIFNGIITGQCAEIVQYSDNKETSVCNLASIALPTFVKEIPNLGEKESVFVFDYEKLHEVTKIIVNNLNKVIDINFYPTEKTKISNNNNRPIGVGVQGISDLFILLDIPFHSEEAKIINKLIFETIYHAALEKSNEISIEYGPYKTFKGSPASKGILQFDMWENSNVTNERYNWTELKNSIINNGIRNSLLIALMPTASTSQILGFNECFEPFTSNLYSRKTLAGEFVVVNKYLMRELIQLGLWNEKIKNNIIENKGSIQQLTILSEHIRNKYKIVWEIPMKHLIDMSADRGVFICQSQSLNLWVEDPNYNTLTSMHFYAWKKGLKTGIYYLRRKAKHQAQQFTIEPIKKEQKEQNCEICEMCSA